LKKLAKKALFRELFKPCVVKETLTKRRIGLCAGVYSQKDRCKQGCKFCPNFIPNAEGWSKSEYPKC